MSKSLHSPTARLLQSSRLFSLPRPLPQPAAESSSGLGMYRHSDTATLPYPVLQAIATPSSSHFRGDWGLKRPLPRKATTNSTTPTIRVQAQDNWEHITDFSSAGDHVKTEEKWRQLGVPLTVRGPKRDYRSAAQSVYDENVDITDREAIKLGGSKSRGRALPGMEQKQQRWKYNGPWIPGMHEGEFDEYVSKRLTQRKGEFRTFLQKRMLEKSIHDEEREMRDQGRSGGITTARVEELRAEVESNYAVEEKKLRDDHLVQHLGSELTAAICDFLDLPGIRMSEQSSMRTQAFAAAFSTFTADGAPPSTHPGAGLSHLRTNAIMDNHPYWGPQAVRSPVKARVLHHRSSSFGPRQLNAKLGVAGVVTQDPMNASYRTAQRTDLPGYDEQEMEQHYLDSDRMTDKLDENLSGGNKIWVQPETAHIDELGRIRLSVTRGDREAIAVKRDQVESIHEARNASYTSGSYGGGGRSASSAYANTRQSHTRGFDEELGRSPLQGAMKDEDAAGRIRSILANYSPAPSKK